MASCRSCGHDVEWATTEATGKAIPLDPGPVTGGNLVVISGKARLFTDEDARLGRERRVSHFVTCPQAAQHRRGRR